jgi:hypothetical protein
MAQTTSIHVTAVDNELYILAVQHAISSEILHIKGGKQHPVNTTIIPQGILTPGNYTLILIGINWDGPQAFSVTLTTGGVNTVHTAPPSTAIGANWTIAVPITV